MSVEDFYVHIAIDSNIRVNSHDTVALFDTYSGMEAVIADVPASVYRAEWLTFLQGPDAEISAELSRLHRRQSTLNLLSLMAFSAGITLVVLSLTVYFSLLESGDMSLLMPCGGLLSGAGVTWLGYFLQTRLDGPRKSAIDQLEEEQRLGRSAFSRRAVSVRLSRYPAALVRQAIDSITPSIHRNLATAITNGEPALVSRAVRLLVEQHAELNTRQTHAEAEHMRQRALKIISNP